MLPALHIFVLPALHIFVLPALHILMPVLFNTSPQLVMPALLSLMFFHSNVHVPVTYFFLMIEGALLCLID